MRVSVLDETKRCCPLGLDHGTANRCNYCKAIIEKLQSSSTVQVDFAWYFVENIFSERCAFWSAKDCRLDFSFLNAYSGWTICAVKMVREYDKKDLCQKRLLCSVIVTKISFFVIQLSVWTNEPHTNRPVTSLGHQGWRRVLWEGPNFFKLCPIILNYVQHIFPGGRKIFHGGNGPLVTGLHTNRRTWSPQLSLMCRLPNCISFHGFNRCFCKVKTRAYETLRSCD